MQTGVRLRASKSAASRSTGCRLRREVERVESLCRRCRDGRSTTGMKDELQARLESSSRWALVEHTPS